MSAKSASEVMTPGGIGLLSAKKIARIVLTILRKVSAFFAPVRDEPFRRDDGRGNLN